MKIAQGKFVITGGASLIGSHVAEQLLSQGAREVVLLDNYALGSPDTVKSLLGDPRVKLVRGDILRINELYDAFEGCDGVFAIAGFLTLPLSQNPSLGLAVNVEGQVNIFETCRYRGVKKVVFSSSIAVYGDPAPGLIDEVRSGALRKIPAGDGAVRVHQADRRESLRSLQRQAWNPGDRAAIRHRLWRAPALSRCQRALHHGELRPHHARRAAGDPGRRQRGA